MSYVGSGITFSIIFTDSTFTEADPTEVFFYLEEGIDGNKLGWIYDAAPVEGVHYPEGMNPIVRDSQGNYSLAWIIRKPERHTGFWHGKGAVNQAQQTTHFAKHTELED